MGGGGEHYFPKFLVQFTPFAFCNKLSLPFPVKKIRRLEEVHDIIGKFHMHKNFMFPKDEVKVVLWRSGIGVGYKVNVP